MDEIRVAVDCDNEIFSRGLVTCLREDPTMVVAPGPDSANGAIDVAVVSPNRVAGSRWDCAVLLCSDSPVDITGLDVHVVGVVPRRSLTRQQLLSAVRAAASGLRVGYLPTVLPDLDGRTVDVLRRIAEGAGIREISDELGYSERTIKSVISGAVRDLGARNRAQAVAEAVRRALI